MRTQFSIAQLQDPDTNEVEKILRKCVHCGFCNTTCPTFQLTGDELDGPRGRIYLLKDMLENQTRPSSKVVSHIDRCLSCLSCTTTCPSGVDYMHLIDHGRSYIEQNHKRDFFDGLRRRALLYLLPKPSRFRILMKISKLLAPAKSLLPNSLQAGLKLASNTRIFEDITKKKTIFPTQNKKIGSVALLPGCTQQVLDDNINAASIRLLNKSGYDVQILNKIECCGAIELHLGKSSLAEDRIKSNLNKLTITLSEFDAIISNASGCGTMLKDYTHLLRADTKYSDAGTRVSKKTMDICEFLELHNFNPDPKIVNKTRVAYQSPCSMQHGQKVSHQAPALLKRFGFTLVDFPENHLCCGSAGTYNILQAPLAESLGQRKSDNIDSSEADVVASGNMGCMLQLRQYSTLPFAHTVELLDWACGGPTPPDLKNNEALSQNR
jgi:glycolate oxidase iron-sulfur subunit